MKFEIGFGDLRKASAELGDDVAAAVTDAMRTTMPIAKGELREQIVRAGLGVRLANSWRGEVYPRLRKSLEPAGYIFSNAPDIVDGYERGATIVPKDGRRYLAIPTENVPRRGNRRGATKRMTPVEVEAAFNQDLFFERGEQGRLLAFVSVVKGGSRSNGRGRARRAPGLRRGTARRLAAGRQLERVLMFTMVPTVRLPKALDIQAVADRWASRFDATVTRNLDR